MVVVMKLKYVDELSGGRKRFRRRYPKAVAEVLGDSVFQVGATEIARRVGIGWASVYRILEEEKAA